MATNRLFSRLATTYWPALVGVVACYYAGVLLGNAGYYLSGEDCRLAIGQQTAAFLAQPTGPLGQGIRPGLGLWIWAAVLGLFAWGRVGIAFGVGLRGVACGQLLAAFGQQTGMGRVWLAGVFWPIELLWMLPVLFQAVRSIRFSARVGACPNGMARRVLRRQTLGRYVVNNLYNLALAAAGGGAAMAYAAVARLVV